jgi:hypothetical protein
MTVSKYLNTTNDPGNRLRVASTVLSGVSATAVASHVDDWAKDRFWARQGGAGTLNPNPNMMAFRAFPRGFLESVLVVQLAGSATAFEVWVLDRWQDGFYMPNLVWRSANVVAYSGQEKHYDPAGGYYYFSPVTQRAIWAYGLMAAYENRAVYTHEEHELYLGIIPNAGADNEFTVKVSTLALA